MVYYRFLTMKMKLKTRNTLKTKVSGFRKCEKDNNSTWHQEGDCEQASQKEEENDDLCMTCSHDGDHHRSACVLAAVGFCYAGEDCSSCSGFDTSPFFLHSTTDGKRNPGLTSEAIKNPNPNNNARVKLHEKSTRQILEPQHKYLSIIYFFLMRME